MKTTEQIKEIQDFIHEKLNQDIVCATKSLANNNGIILAYNPFTKDFYVQRDTYDGVSFKKSFNFLEDACKCFDEY